MELHTFFVYLLIMAGSTYLIRAIPFSLVREKIENKWIRSFLYYVPYVSLSVMTFPAILTATSSFWSGLAGFLVAVTAAWVDGNLFRVSISACVAVYLAELIL